MSMWLLADIGNTRLKWRWAEGSLLRPGGAEALPPVGHEAALFSRLWAAGEVPDRLMVSNVAGPHVAESLRDWSMGHWGLQPTFVSSEARQCGVTNGYANPQSLGVDRWCGLIGARALVAAPVCVVDCGTAATLDVLTATGEHQGGLILPGLRAMLHALTSTARGIRGEVPPAPAATVLGRSTTECMRAGVLAATAGMVEHALARLGFPTDGQVILTGGDAALVASALARPARIEADLVFHGLAQIALEGKTA
jgi:type III pantothenate kinase